MRTLVTRPAALALLALSSMVSLGSAQDPARPTPPPYVEASGVGETRISPDRATVNLTVETKGPAAAAVAAQNARVQRLVLDTLRVLGFSGTQVSTVSFNVEPNYVESPRGPRPEGYVARNAVRVQLTQLDRIGVIIDAALAKGATSVGYVHFEASNTEPARQTAIAQAAERARGEATALARAMGGSLGPLLEVSTAGDRSFTRMMDLQAVQVRRREYAAGTPISPSEIVVSAVVVARWRFVPAP